MRCHLVPSAGGLEKRHSTFAEDSKERHGVIPATLECALRAARTAF